MPELPFIYYTQVLSYPNASCAGSIAHQKILCTMYVHVHEITTRLVDNSVDISDFLSRFLNVSATQCFLSSGYQYVKSRSLYTLYSGFFSGRSGEHTRDSVQTALPLPVSCCPLYSETRYGKVLVIHYFLNSTMLLLKLILIHYVCNAHLH